MPQHSRADDKDGVTIQPKAISLLWFLISTISILMAIGIGWGQTHAEVVSIRENAIRVEDRLDVLEKEVHSHHESSDRHMDKSFRDDVLGQLREMRSLLMQHMGETGRKNKAQ
jgi:hypothetical protein